MQSLTFLKRKEKKKKKQSRNTSKEMVEKEVKVSLGSEMKCLHCRLVSSH